MLLDNEKPHWAPKVSQAKIRLLYERDAQGIIDLDLLDQGDGRFGNVVTVF